MSEITFAEALQRELRLRGVSFDCGEVYEFVEESWRRVGTDPDIGQWADRFLGTPPTTLAR